MRRKSIGLTFAFAWMISSACAPTVVTPTESVEPPPPKELEETGPLDCQQDMNCFIQAAEDCQESGVMFVFPLDFMGVLVTSTSALTIEGVEMEQCVFHIKTEAVEIAYSDEAIQMFKDSGLSEADIEAQRIDQQNASLEAGYDDTCRGNAGDLVTLLSNWQQGSISTEDLNPFTCEGKVTSSMTDEIVIEFDETEIIVEDDADGNLIENATFDQDPMAAATVWRVETRGTNLAAQWSSDYAKLGDHSLSLYASTTGNQGWPGWFTADLIPIEQGKQYAFRAWAITPDGADAYGSIELYDASGQMTTAISSGCVDIPVDTWSRVLVSLLPERTEGVTHVRLGLLQCLSSTEGEVTHLYFDEVFFGLLEDLPQ